MFTTVVSLSSFLQLLGFDEDSGRAWLKEWNPWNDEFIDELLTLRLNLQRELFTRAGRYKRQYWESLPVTDQLIAEAEAEWLAEQVWQTYEIQWAYTLDMYLGQDIAMLEGYIANPKEWIRVFQKASKEHKTSIDFLSRMTNKAESANMRTYTTADMLKRMIQFGAISSLVQQDTLIAANEQEMMFTPVDEGSAGERLKFFTQLDARMHRYLRMHRNHIAPRQAQLRLGRAAMLHDFFGAANRNELQGAAAKDHILLSNRNIPLPTLNSIQGWWQYAGVVIRKLTGVEGKAFAFMIPGGWRPDYVMTYVPPLMPMTKEHLSHGSADSTGDISWSLPFRSKGHTRDSEGRIQYGMWQARTSLISTSGNLIARVINENLQHLSISRLSYHEGHMATMPSIKSSAQLLALRHGARFWPAISNSDTSMIQTCVADPNFAEPTTTYPILDLNQPVHYTWASLSKFSGVHLRFDQTPEGIEALEAWCDEFETMVGIMIRAPHIEFIRLAMQTAVQVTGDIRVEGSRVTHKNKDGSSATFDFGSLGL